MKSEEFNDKIIIKKEKSMPNNILDIKALLQGDLLDNEEVKDTHSVGSDKDRRDSLKQYVTAVHTYLPAHKKTADDNEETKDSSGKSKEKS